MAELLLDKRMLLPIQVSLKLAVRALFRGGRNLRESLWGRDKNRTLVSRLWVSSHHSSVGMVSWVCFMVAYILTYVTVTQLIGHISVPHLRGFFTGLECPRTSFTGSLSSRFSLTEWVQSDFQPTLCQMSLPGSSGMENPLLSSHGHRSPRSQPCWGRKRDFTVKPEPAELDTVLISLFSWGTYKPWKQK